MKKTILMMLLFSEAVISKAQDFDNANRPYNNYSHRIHVLDKREFAQLQDVIKKVPFADDKKNAFRLNLDRSFITVDQLSEFIKQFPFNDDKLDWLMLAYPYSADKQRFYQLRNSLTFISTQEKFDQFILNMADNDDLRHRDRKIIGRDEFARLQASINKEPFAADKKNVFKLALQNRFISVAQVSELMRRLTFDDEKLDWALLAYNYTADTQKYYQLRDLFTFDTSKQKLDKFLLQAAE